MPGEHKGPKRGKDYPNEVSTCSRALDQRICACGLNKVGNSSPGWVLEHWPGALTLNKFCFILWFSPEKPHTYPKNTHKMQLDTQRRNPKVYIQYSTSQKKREKAETSYCPTKCVIVAQLIHHACAPVKQVIEWWEEIVPMRIWGLTLSDWTNYLTIASMKTEIPNIR